MHIGALLRSVIGDQFGTDQRSIALKPGQVVRGTIVQLLQQNEAIVSIHGIPVRLGLEHPLPEGHTAMLQVVEGDDGHLVARLASQGTASSSASISAFLQQHGWPNDPALHPLIQIILQDGLALTKTDAESLYTLFANKPKHIPINQWNDTLVSLLKRNLPLTNESALALRQVLFGTSLQNIVLDFERNIEAYSGRMQSGNSKGSSLLTSIQQLLTELKQTSARIAAPPLHQSSGSVQSLQSMPPLSQSVNETQNRNLIVNTDRSLRMASAWEFANDTYNQNRSNGPDGVTPARSSQQLVQSIVLAMVNHASSDREPSLLSLTNRMSSEQTHTVPSMSAPQANSASIQAAVRSGRFVSEMIQPLTQNAVQEQPAVQQPATQQQNAVQQQRMMQEQHNLQGASSSRIGANEAIQHEASSSRPAASAQWNPIVQLLKLVGIDYESSLIERMSRLNDPSPLQGNNMFAGLNTDGNLVRSEGTNSFASLKSLLLQLQQSDEFPLPLRDSAQQLLQHITGQQLLLAADRSSMMTHMMLLVPIFNEEGQQTAAISIQSRRQRNGSIDAHNCRLLFDLSMSVLGNTIIDVKVADKKVFLSILNDHPELKQLVDSNGSILKEALRSAGYEVMSLQTGAYPQANAAAENVANDTKTFGGESRSSESRSWRSLSAYRGVDVRI